MPSGYSKTWLSLCHHEGQLIVVVVVVTTLVRPAFASPIRFRGLVFIISAESVKVKLPVSVLVSAQSKFLNFGLVSFWATEQRRTNRTDTFIIWKAVWNLVPSFEWRLNFRFTSIDRLRFANGIRYFISSMIHSSPQYACMTFQVVTFLVTWYH